jgi:hypothetical protein
MARTCHAAPERASIGTGIGPDPARDWKHSPAAMWQKQGSAVVRQGLTLHHCFQIMCQSGIKTADLPKIEIGAAPVAQG